MIYGDGEQARDFAFIDDVVEANVLAARAREEALGRAFNIGGGAEPTSVNRLLELIADSCDVELEPVHEPERQGDIRRSEADASLARGRCWVSSPRSASSMGCVAPLTGSGDACEVPTFGRRTDALGSMQTPSDERLPSWVEPGG